MSMTSVQKSIHDQAMGYHSDTSANYIARDAGKPVHLLREPNGTVWVLQEFTKAVDPSLTPENLDTIGSKLRNLPEGWTFETKVLTKNLELDTHRAGGWAAIIRDELHNTYQGCGYGTDASANYVL